MHSRHIRLVPGPSSSSLLFRRPEAPPTPDTGPAHPRPVFKMAAAEAERRYLAPHSWEWTAVSMKANVFAEGGVQVSC